MLPLSLKKDALELRNKWDLGSAEPIVFESLLIKLNIITAFKPLPVLFSGMAVKSDKHQFMLINSNHSLGRQHFTICHEFFHLFVDTSFKPHQCTTGNFNKDDATEYAADLFASYFLIPEEGIIKNIPDNELAKDKIAIETLLKLEHSYQCSRTALLVRLKELGIITSKSYEKFNSNIKQTAIQYGYSVSLYEKANENKYIGDFGVKARQLFDQDKISEGHYASLMQTIGIDVFKTFQDEENS